MSGEQAVGFGIFPHGLRIEFCQYLNYIDKNGRGGEIRTHDLLYPKQARYQATLRPDTGAVRLPTDKRKGNAEFYEHLSRSQALHPKVKGRNFASSLA